MAEATQSLPSGVQYRWQPQEPVSPEEYLRRERVSLEKSEYYDGRPHPLYPPEHPAGAHMAGATRNHIFISANVLDALRASLRETACVAVGSDMRIRTDPEGAFYYPDVVVVCGEEQYAKETSQANLLNPSLIVEVLSASTEQKDRGEKFAAYRRLDSLREYVLVSQKQRAVEVFRKNEAGHWVLYEFGSGAQHVELTTAEARLAMDAIYEGVERGT